MPDKDTLRTLLTRKPILVAPGVYDAFTALNASLAGFSTLYVSGAAIAYTRLGRPDIGLVSMSEVAETVSAHSRSRRRASDRRCRHRLRQRAQRRAHGARPSSARAPPRSRSRIRISPSAAAISTARRWCRPTEMLGKIKAALDARHSRETLVIARTDAVAVEGLRPRDRARAALIARPAPMCCSSRRRRRATTSPASWQRSAPRVPLMANMVEGGKTPPLSGGGA